MTKYTALIILISLTFVECRETVNQIDSESEKPEVVSDLFGNPLHPLTESDSVVSRKQKQLEEANLNFEENPGSLGNIIWYGRRLAYLYMYHEAINVYSKGLEIHPESPELYRHRGHRYISIRNFDKAISDFEKAASNVESMEIEIEPDGIPNQINQPLSTLQFNIWYHWALAHYLKGEFEEAEKIYRTCMEYSTNPDLLVATSDWYYMTLRRLGKEVEAGKILEAITPELNIIENESYFKRLLMYKGLIQTDELLDLNNEDEDAQLDIVTQGYGVGNWYYYNGEVEKAREIFEKILECDYWPAFGYIAAEADLFRGL